MPLQPPTYVGLLDPTDPKGTDSRTISDDYHRMIQESCRQTTPNYTNEVTATHSDTNLLSGYVANGVKPLPGEGGVTTIFHYGSTAPTGYTIFAPDTNLRELIIGPAASGGIIGGSMNPTSMSDTVSISISVSGTTGTTELPHSHGAGTINVSTSTDNQAGPGTGPTTVAEGGHRHTLSGQTGDSIGQTGHNHSFSDSGSDSDTVTLTPRYARGILMQLDA